MLKIGLKTRQLLLGPILLALSAGASQAAATSSVNDVKAMIEQATRSQQQARAEGHGWTITATYIDQAKTELAANRLDSAMAAAQRALLTANKSLEQAASEETAWQARVPTL